MKIDVLQGVVASLHVPRNLVAPLFFRHLLQIVLLLQTYMLLIQQFALLGVRHALFIAKLLGTVLRQQYVTECHGFAQLFHLRHFLTGFVADHRI